MVSLQLARLSTAGCALLGLVLTSACAPRDSADTAAPQPTQSSSPQAAATPAPEGPEPTAPSSDLAAAGREVFAKNGCMNCHAVNGEGAPKAPDLSRVGSETEHTTEWLIAHVKNPRAHKPESKMPAFEGKISDPDLLALGAYLASLK